MPPVIRLEKRPGVKREMEVFQHHIYEYKKGLRRMVLHTAPAQHEEWISRKLAAQGITHLIVPVSESKINVFFGDPEYIKVIQSFGKLNLVELSDEQDFILGALLGYDLALQCKRLLRRRNAAGRICSCG